MANVEKIWSEVPRSWPTDGPPSDAAIARAEKLLLRLKPRDLLPTDAGRGYWPTVILVWGDAPADVEVFDHGYELNINTPNEAGRMFEVHAFDGFDEQCLHRLVEKLEAVLKSCSMAPKPAPHPPSP